MPKAVRTAPKSICVQTGHLRPAGAPGNERNIFACVEKRRTRLQHPPLSPPLHHPSRLARNVLGRETLRRMRFPGGAGVAGDGWRGGDEALAHRSLVTLPIMQLPRQQGEAREKGRGRRMSMGSPEVA